MIKINRLIHTAKLATDYSDYSENLTTDSWSFYTNESVQSVQLAAKDEGCHLPLAPFWVIPPKTHEIGGKKELLFSIVDVKRSALILPTVRSH